MTKQLPQSQITLPWGWANTKLQYLVEPSKDKVNPSEIDCVPYVGLEHIEKGKGALLGHGYSAEVRSTKTRFYQGDFLYGKLRPYLNKVYLADFEGICSTDILVFPNSQHLSNRYFVTVHRFFL